MKESQLPLQEAVGCAWEPYPGQLQNDLDKEIWEEVCIKHVHTANAPCAVYRCAWCYYRTGVSYYPECPNTYCGLEGTVLRSMEEAQIVNQR